MFSVQSTETTDFLHRIPFTQCEATAQEREALLDTARSLPSICVTSRDLSQLYMLGVGGYSPLTGFMTREVYESVLDTMRLPGGIAWTIPITLPVTKEDISRITIGQTVALTSQYGDIIATLAIEDIFSPNLEKEALLVYGTDDIQHPGVAQTLQKSPCYLGGKVTVLNRGKILDPIEEPYAFEPTATRHYFKERGWKRIVGFQTRNPPHRSHEYIQKTALESCDGLFIHPLVGETKSGDITSNVRIACYKTLVDSYFPKDRTLLGVLPAPMYYAGPREAIHHAIMRRNYGCTHFIVGRDHAGVGKYYGTFDAHFIFNEFDIDRELGIRPLFFDHAFYCNACGNMASYKTCPHDAEQQVILSGTKVRELLSKGEAPPETFMRPEIAAILVEANKQELVFNI